MLKKIQLLLIARIIIMSCEIGNPIFDEETIEANAPTSKVYFNGFNYRQIENL